MKWADMTAPSFSLFDWEDWEDWANAPRGLDSGSPYRRTKVRANSVCLPHAGGSASFSFPLSRSLSADLDVIAVQYPGRQDRWRERCMENLDELAERVYATVALLTDRPLSLFGHSMGAALGFEVARLLEQRADAVPAHLFVSGRRAPSRHRDETVHQLGDEGLLADVRRLSGTDSRILEDDEVLQMALPAFRADYKAIETYRYRPGPPLQCPIMAFTGDNDPKATVDEVRSWSEHTVADFGMKVYPGGHFFLSGQQEAIRREVAGTLLAGRGA
ncbi:thioesterase II family protein [Streptomyces sp. NPDC048638]|uniref:thioesterase II family protein n=1 Tax=Streptomyces sp. NPDC048638 TaxID=3365580 RepID=UPI003714FA54